LNRSFHISRSDPVYIRKIAESNSNVDTIYYVYDGMNVVVELDGSLNKKTSYGYIGAMLVMVEDEADNKHYYSHDGLGSIIAIYDASGNYVNVYMYDEFGNFLRKTESVVNSYYYTGQELDRWSGLYNLRNRYYSPGIGRFTQLDPIVDLLGIENMQELNGYAYVANNPMILIDPFGLCGGDGLPDWVPEWLWSENDYIFALHGVGAGVKILGGEGGVMYVISPSTKDYHYWIYGSLGLGYTVGFAITGQVEVGSFHYEGNIAEMPNWSWTIAGFAASKFGVSAQISIPTGDRAWDLTPTGDLGAAGGLGIGAGAGAYLMRTRTWYQGTGNVRYLPKEVKKAVEGYLNLTK